MLNHDGQEVRKLLSPEVLDHYLNDKNGKQTVMIEGHFLVIDMVRTASNKWPNNSRFWEDKKCFLSLRPIRPGDQIRLIIGNGKFPNCWVLEEEFDKLGIKEAVYTLYCEYKIAELFRHWYS